MSEVTTTAGAPDPAKMAAAVAAARTVVAEIVARLTEEWEDEPASDGERLELFAEALGFQEIGLRGLGFGYRRDGLFVRQREEGEIAPVPSWSLHHEASRKALPAARFEAIERAFAAALALLYVGVDWTAAVAWTGDVPTVAGLVLRPFVEEEAAAAAARAHELAEALRTLDAIAAWTEAGRPHATSDEGTAP